MKMMIKHEINVSSIDIEMSFLLILDIFIQLTRDHIGKKKAYC